MDDHVDHRHEMRATLARLCRILTKADAVKPVGAAEATTPPAPDADAAASASPA